MPAFLPAWMMVRVQSTACFVDSQIQIENVAEPQVDVQRFGIIRVYSIERSRCFKEFREALVRTCDGDRPLSCSRCRSGIAWMSFGSSGQLERSALFTHRRVQFHYVRRTRELTCIGSLPIHETLVPSLSHELAVGRMLPTPPMSKQL